MARTAAITAIGSPTTRATTGCAVTGRRGPSGRPARVGAARSRLWWPGWMPAAAQLGVDPAQVVAAARRRAPVPAPRAGPAPGAGAAGGRPGVRRSRRRPAAAGRARWAQLVGRALAGDDAVLDEHEVGRARGCRSRPTRRERRTTSSPAGQRSRRGRRVALLLRPLATTTSRAPARRRRRRDELLPEGPAHAAARGEERQQGPPARAVDRSTCAGAPSQVVVPTTSRRGWSPAGSRGTTPGSICTGHRAGPCRTPCWPAPAPRRPSRAPARRRARAGPAGSGRGCAAARARARRAARWPPPRR